MGEYIVEYYRGYKGSCRDGCSAGNRPKESRRLPDAYFDVSCELPGALSL